MLVHQAYRFEVDPNNRVRAQFASHCGASRFCFNWGLEVVQRQRALRRKMRAAARRELLSDEEVERLALTVDLPWSMYDLRRLWNLSKDDVAPWWKENSKFAYESGLKALADALANYSASKKGTRAGAIVEFPNHKKHHARHATRFWAAPGLAVVDERHIRLPRIGVVRSKEMTSELLEKLDTSSVRILNATLKEEAGRWFVSFCCEVDRRDNPAEFPDAVVGVDLGIHHLAALSTGKLVKNPKPLSRYQRKIARLQRELDRRQKGSKRRERTKARFANRHRQVRCTRADALHQLTSKLASTYGTVVVENLRVANMARAPRPKPDKDHPGAYMKNGRKAKAGLNRALFDTAPGEFRRLLSYKLTWRGGKLVVADRFFPSSKLCSSCGSVKAKLSRSTRTYRCTCGLVIDRDLNAAQNLAALVHDVSGGSPETENGVFRHECGSRGRNSRS